MTTPEPLDVAVRAWAPPTGWTVRPSRGRRHRPTAMVVFDCETTIEHDQALLVGCYRYAWLTWQKNVPAFSVVEEGLFVPDDLGGRDPDALSLVRRYAAARYPRVDSSIREANPELVVLTRGEFCERMVWEACWRDHTTLCAFNLPFDLSRLRLSHTKGKKKAGGIDWLGAWTFRLWEHHGETDDEVEHPFRPDVRVRRLDSKRALMAFGGAKGPPDDGYSHRHRFADDHLLDLRALLFAIFNESHSLESGCAALGVTYEKPEVKLGVLSEELLDYVRGDVAATTDLAQAALAEFHRHPVPLAADRAFSPATLGTAYLRAAKVRPPLSRPDRLDDTRLAQAMAAFYGPRVEVRVRHVEVPVTLIDFPSLYANVARLSGLSDLLTSAYNELVDGPDAVRAVQELVEGSSLQAVLDPATWPMLVGVASIRPEGLRLPVRAYFSGPADLPRVGIGPLFSDRPCYYAIADLLAASLLGAAIDGRPPPVEIEDAWLVRPHGLDPGVGSVAIRRRVPCRPGKDDLLASFMRARRATPGDPRAEATKTITNGGIAYGCWVRFDDQPRPGRVDWCLPSGELRQVRVGHPERPAEFTYPLYAAMATAGGRLAMAALEVLLADAGTTWAAANTDSAAIPSAKHGCLVACPGGPERLPDGTEALRVLSWAEVDAICHRFDPLGIAPRLEKENFDNEAARRELHCLGISGSRVAYYGKDSDGDPEPVKVSEVGLGDLRDPVTGGTTREWVTELARWAIQKLQVGDAERPDWFRKVATSQFPVSTPERLHQLAGHGSPLGFVMVARRARQARLQLGSERRRLVAPLVDDPEAWPSAPWWDPTERATARIVNATEREGLSADLFDADEYLLSTYEDEMNRWLRHRETKMLGTDGRVCGAFTRGLLHPRPVRVSLVRYVGRESNQIEEVEAGEIEDLDEVLTVYGDDGWEHLVIPVLRDMTASVVAARADMRRASVSGLLRKSKPASPQASSRATLLEVAGEWATDQLQAWGLGESSEPHHAVATVLARYLAERSKHQCRCAVPGCDKPARRPPSVTCSDGHKKALRRMAGSETSLRCDCEFNRENEVATFP